MRWQSHAFVLAGLLVPALGFAAPSAPLDGCYLRPQPKMESAASAPAAAAQVQSSLGLRRRAGQLYELEISIAGAGGAHCTVSGVARLRRELGAGVLGMPVRRDAALGGAVSTPCQIFVHPTPAALELRTTAAFCQAQALCGGRVEIDGLRFELAARIEPSAPGPCFAPRAP